MTQRWLQVAVPLPLPGPLTYEPPAGWTADVPPGVRVRVRVGRRLVTGLVVGVGQPPPAGVETRHAEELLDREPVLTPDLLDLARFVADYYLAPIGEVVRTMVPADLTAWGRQRIRLTDRGALATPRSDAEEEVLAVLRDAGALRTGELQRRVPRADLGEVLQRLREGGRITIEQPEERGRRYRSAVELSAGDLDELLERCGRSRPGREVVRFLEALARPAGIEEICRAVGCGPGVVRRLVRLGVLRSFTEIRRLDLDDHRLPAASPGEPLALRPDQQAAYQPLAEALDAGSFAAFLLAGITGSGKTEVYLRAVDRVLQQGRTALLLVPEIALVPSLCREVTTRFGDAAAVLHSGLGSGERSQEWERARSGAARVVLGARSAVFAPLPELGLVVVDEEQDPAYKQDSVPRYHGRDLALVRARSADAVALLVSATPSLESRHNVEVGKLSPLVLTRRVGRGLAEGILVDLREEEPSTRRPGEVTFSSRLQEEIAGALDRQEQVVLLRNRRGYSPILLCRACGEDHRCDDCGLPRTYHRRSQGLVCHYCGSVRPRPEVCSTCGEAALEAIGAGTERVEERFRDLFPHAAVAVLDRDTAQRRGGAAAVLERFERGEVQVLVGTQMVSKGHHFPRVGLAAVLAADTYLGFPDFRAVERTYNLITQLAGRAGRGDLPGRVVIQTYHPDHYAVQAAFHHDDEAFAREEMRFRRIFHYPPYTRMIQLLVRDRSRDRAEASVRELAARLETHPLAGGVRILGPAPAPLERLRGRWRFQVLLRAPSGGRLRRMVADTVGPSSPRDLVVDVDPQSLM